jgi:hypothetical protein
MKYGNGGHLYLWVICIYLDTKIQMTVHQSTVSNEMYSARPAQPRAYNTNQGRALSVAIHMKQRHKRNIALFICPISQSAGMVARFC